MQIERLRLLDMFLLYPSLLYRVSLPAAIKQVFRSLRLERPDQIFIRLPSNASIWQDLQLYQTAAVTRLGGIGILRNEALRARVADPDWERVPQPLAERVEVANAEQHDLMRFLVHELAELPMSGRDNLFKRSALPARGPLL